MPTLQPYTPPTGTSNTLVEPSPPPVRSLATVHELTIEDVLAQITKIQKVMKEAMVEGEHYGVIPGTGTKPSLLQAGSQKLCLTFRLDPEYDIIEKVVDGNHVSYISRCTLYHIPTGLRMGSGMGSCSTKEKKYAWRTQKRSCPKCGSEAIFKSKFPPKDKKLGKEPGWYCFAKQGGCGAEYPPNDALIINQPIGVIPNPDLPDLWNTVLKMSNKRAQAAAVLTVTAASDIFTQDVEDMGDSVDLNHKPIPTKPTAPTIETDAEVDDEIVITDPEPDRRESAPLQEWLDAFERPTTPQGLQVFWRSCIAPDVWKGWNGEEQIALHAAHGAAWDRLVATAPTADALRALWTIITSKPNWDTWDPKERAKRVTTKDAAKVRLGVE